MKRIAKASLIFCLLFTLTSVQLYAENLVTNGEFDDGLNAWGGWIDEANTQVEVTLDETGQLSGDNSMKVNVVLGSADTWRVQRVQNIPLLEGHTYQASFMAKCETGTAILEVFSQMEADPYPNYLNQSLEITPEAQMFGPFLFSPASDDTLNNFGFRFGGQDSVVIWVDAVVLEDITGTWQSADLGQPAIPGDASMDDDGVLSMKAGGIDIWNEKDEGHFFYQPYSMETLELTCRIVSIDSADAWSKGCVMIRESLADSARHYSVFTGFQNQVRFGKRADLGGSSSSMKPKDEEGNDIGGAAYEERPVWLKIIREGQKFRGYFSMDGAAWKRIGVTDTLGIPTDVVIGIALTSHNPDDSTHAVFDNISISDEITLPDVADWRNMDLGQPAITGNVSWDMDGTLTMKAGGIDIWNEKDEGHFLYMPYNSRNLELTCRIISIDSADVWSKGCVMIRESLADSARHYSVFTGFGNQVRFGKRAELGGSSSSMKPKDEEGNDIGGAAYEERPVWLKIIRESEHFRGYFSLDGETWKRIGVTDTLGIPTKAYIGLAATSHSPDDSTHIGFDNITYSDEITIPDVDDWRSVDLGPVQFPGSMSWDMDKTLTMEASGVDIWNNKDEGHFVYQPWSGSTCEITCRVVSIDSADAWSKGCVMIRESLADSARHYSVFTGFQNQVRFGKRADLGGSSSSMKPKDESGNDISGAAYESRPVWLKLIREGDQFRGYFSTDGSAWQQIG